MTCDAKGCDEPAVADMTYWVRGHAMFHLCRGHWEKIGSDGREELWQLLGIPRPPDA